MARFPTDYTVEQLLDVERSYHYDASTRYRTLPAASTGRTLPVTLFAALLAVAPCPLPKPSSPVFSITDVAALTQQAQEATTESADFRRLVRQLAPAPLKQLPAPGLAPGPDFKLGDVDFYDDLAMQPATVPTKRVRVRVKNSYWAEPSIRDLSAATLSTLDAAV